MSKSRIVFFTPDNTLATYFGKNKTHHGNGIGGKQLLGAHGGDVGYVGEDVNEGHEGDGDEDGTWKVPKNKTKHNTFTQKKRRKLRK